MTYLLPELDLQTNALCVVLPLLFVFLIVKLWPTPPSLSTTEVIDIKRRLKVRW